jgi:hypothetical protein
MPFQTSDDRRNLILAEVEKNPEIRKKTLAKLLHERHPMEFPTFQKAYGAVRYHLGANGDKDRRVIKKQGVEPVPNQGPLKLPKGERQLKKPIRLNTPGKYLLTSDWHVPYHDEVALELAIKTGVDAGCEHFYLNGDGIDFYQHSQWLRDPLKRDPYKELNLLWNILDQVLPLFPGEKYYKIGNHEDRYTRRVWESTPEMASNPRFKLENVLEVKERGMRVVRSKQWAKIGKTQTAIFHGHELPRGLTNPVNVARGLWLRVRDPSITSHWHQTSTHVESSGVRKDSIICYSMGCLCDRNPSYGPINRWNAGFMVIHLKEDRSLDVTNYVIDRGEVVVAG